MAMQVGEKGATIAEINVTPMADVMIVLLIIFMVVTPMLQTGVDVALPETRKPEKIPESQKQLSVAIKSSGEVFVGQDWVPQDQLRARLEAIASRTPVTARIVPTLTSGLLGQITSARAPPIASSTPGPGRASAIPP